MDIYVLQIYTGEESKFVASIRDQLSIHNAELLWPRRELTIRRRGKRLKSLAPVFPGYVFLQTDSFTEAMFRLAKGSTGFIRFLESNRNIRPLHGSDLLLVRHFLGYGEIVQKSKVQFDANQRIVVLDGPLEGLEGRIVKVNRRKGRAKVQLDLYNASFTIDFGFEVLERSPEKPGKEK